ncbi:amidohydrolase family protein [Tomitella fengzijianii]|uniref:Amidohydrolase family protein n=1 Tax=Tomitella fengzijianii TaxID=2597660 RepID=A0A516X899_9ACTN|nr:amidohydrolase family protein [Tomitella fengzijianii]
MDAGPWRIRGTALPGGDPVEWYLHDGRLTTAPVPGARDLGDGGWLLPGLMDAHCHVGIGRGSRGVGREECLAQARLERDRGVLLIRDCGVPVDTRGLDAVAGLPRIIRAGQHLARPKRYLRELGLALDDPAQLPEAVEEQARAGDGWVKLVGDWIDRSVGDLAPLWDDDILVEAIARAHAAGARVTAHVFGEDALPGLLRAGIDCIEHGTGLTAETIDMMRSRGTALVPTLINIANFPEIADGATRYPDYARHMRALHARLGETMRAVVDAGIPVYSGTDAGGMIDHGRIVDEVEALAAAGLGAEGAVAAASWRGRRWLTGADKSNPGLYGVDRADARADLVLYPEDPRVHPRVLREPTLVVAGGVPVIPAVPA